MEEVQLAEELFNLANVAAIPVVIIVTNLLKKNFQFKHKSNLLALFVSFVVCSVWGVYTLTPEQMAILTAGGGFSFYRFSIDHIIISFATWFAASKGYDLVSGDKKRERVLVEHKDEIRKLQKKARRDDGTTEESSEISEKLRSSLEEEG